MPEYVYAGQGATYPDLRDSSGQLVNEASPGDVRPFDAAPDQWWRELGDEDQARIAAEEAEQAAAEAEAALKAAEERAVPPASTGPVPAPPAAVPPAIPPSPAGETGSEE